MRNRKVTVLVATDEEGFSLHRVSGPNRWMHMGRHFRQSRDIRLASAAIAALHAIPYRFFKAQVGLEHTAKLPVLLRAYDADFLEKMERLDEIAEDAPTEWLLLKRLMRKYDFELKKVDRLGPSMENLKSFHLTHTIG